MTSYHSTTSADDVRDLFDGLIDEGDDLSSLTTATSTVATPTIIPLPRPARTSSGRSLLDSGVHGGASSSSSKRKAGGGISGGPAKRQAKAYEHATNAAVASVPVIPWQQANESSKNLASLTTTLGLPSSDDTDLDQPDDGTSNSRRGGSSRNAPNTESSSGGGGFDLDLDGLPSLSGYSSIQHLGLDSWQQFQQGEAGHGEERDNEIPHSQSHSSRSLEIPTSEAPLEGALLAALASEVPVRVEETPEEVEARARATAAELEELTSLDVALGAAAAAAAALPLKPSSSTLHSDQIDPNLEGPSLPLVPAGTGIGGALDEIQVGPSTKKRRANNKTPGSGASSASQSAKPRPSPSTSNANASTSTSIPNKPVSNHPPAANGIGVLGITAREAAQSFAGDEEHHHPCPQPDCDRTFARKSDFLRHFRIHTGERPFACEHEGCDKTFIQRSALTVHYRVHSGDKPHACTECQRHFSDSSSLARHRRVHAGLKPFKCDRCNLKSFSRKATLTRHQTICPGGDRNGKMRANNVNNNQPADIDTTTSISPDDAAKPTRLNKPSRSKGPKVHPSVQIPGELNVNEEENEDQLFEPEDDFDEEGDLIVSAGDHPLDIPVLPTPIPPVATPSAVTPTTTSNASTGGGKTPRRPILPAASSSIRQLGPTVSPSSELGSVTSDTRTEVQPVPRPSRVDVDDIGDMTGVTEDQQAAVRLLVSGFRSLDDELALPSSGLEV